MKTLRIVRRLLILAVHIVAGLIKILIYLRHVEGNAPNPRQKRMIQHWLARASHIIGLRIHIRGEIPMDTVLVVANHISWMDILAIASALPVSFLSKSEIREWPVIGKLTGGSGTLFIQRGARDAASRASKDMARHMRMGQNVVIFPEATTTDGRGVKRFHARLFGAAIDAAMPIQPVAIRYPHESGVNPSAPFINDDTFAGHALNVLGSDRVDVELTFLPALLMPNARRKAVAEASRQRILQIIENNTPPGVSTSASRFSKSMDIDEVIESSE